MQTSLRFLGLVSGVLSVSLLAAAPPTTSKPIAAPAIASQDAPGVEATKAPATSPAPAEKEKEVPASPGALRLYLMEGSVVSGKLSVEQISVATDFGTLQVPVSEILSFTPGLDSHPSERARISRLIAQLGANAAAERDEAQKALSELGLAVRAQLNAHANDEDPERRKRVQLILNELEDQSEEEPETVQATGLVDDDTLTTTRFTVVGKISPKSFEVQTQFGPLTVALTDIRRGQRESGSKAEVRKNVSVSGNNLVQLQFQDGVRVNRGDKVSIKADGTLVMSPWGNNSVSTPNGDQRFQWYIPNKIPGGALVARVGSTGEIFMVGADHTFVATRSGELSFAVAMHPQYANQGYNYPGEYSVKVRVNPK